MSVSVQTGLHKSSQAIFTKLCIDYCCGKNQFLDQSYSEWVNAVNCSYFWFLLQCIE